MIETPSCSQNVPAELQALAEAEWSEVRRQIRQRVLNEITEIVDAAIKKAKDGHYQVMKYLFELAGLYPEPTEESGKDDCSLARILCDRLGLPATPERVAAGDVLRVGDKVAEHGNGHALE